MEKLKTNRLFLVGGSSILGNSIANNFLEENLISEVIKITRNEKLITNNEFLYVDDYIKIEDFLEEIEPNEGDIFLLAFAYLGNTGFSKREYLSLEQNNQKKVFHINLFKMIHVLNYSVKFLSKKGGSIIYLSSAAAYPPRSSNLPYSLSKKFIDEILKVQKEYFKLKNVTTMSVKIGFVDTPLNKGKKPTPFSSTPEQVSKLVVKAYVSNKSSVYIPKSIFIITVILRAFKPITKYLDKKYS